MFETFDGPMELDFDDMTLYVQRGDLCWKLEVCDRYALPSWMATCPMTGRQLLIIQRITGVKQCRYYVQRPDTLETIGISPAYDLDR